MGVLDAGELLFPETQGGRFVLYSCGSKVGEVALPEKGITYFPPEVEITGSGARLILRLRLDFADGEALAAIRRVLRFWQDDPHRHSLRLVLPGERGRGYEVVPDGRWRAWFFDDEPKGYGPVELQFASSDVVDVSEPAFCEVTPWVVE